MHSEPYHGTLEDEEEEGGHEETPRHWRHADHERFAVFEAQTSTHHSTLKKKVMLRRVHPQTFRIW